MQDERKTRTVPDARRQAVFAQEARRGYEPIKTESVKGRKRRTWRITFQKRVRGVPPPPPHPEPERWTRREFNARESPTEPSSPGLVASAQYMAVGQREGLSGFDLSRFTRVLRIRRPEGMEEAEVKEWAHHFRDHVEWDYLSAEGRRVLLETDGIAIQRGTVGPITHAHNHHFYREEQVQRIIARGQKPIVHHGGPCGPECAKGHAGHVHKRGKSHQVRG